MGIFPFEVVKKALILAILKTKPKPKV